MNTDVEINSSRFSDVFVDNRAMAIIRGLPAAEAVAMATRIWDSGISLVEVTIHKPNMMDSLAAVVEAGRDRNLPVGAGTVTSFDQLSELEKIGVTFAVSPGYDRDLVIAAAARDIPFMPGVATATEVQSAMGLGVTWLKAFPANVLGVKWLKAMRGPFPEANFVATGGIDASNAREFLEAGARVVAIGSALGNSEQLGSFQRAISAAR